MQALLVANPDLGLVRREHRPKIRLSQATVGKELAIFEWERHGPDGRGLIDQSRLTERCDVLGVDENEELNRKPYDTPGGWAAGYLSVHGFMVYRSNTPPG